MRVLAQRISSWGKEANKADAEAGEDPLMNWCRRSWRFPRIECELEQLPRKAIPCLDLAPLLGPKRQTKQLHSA